MNDIVEKGGGLLAGFGYIQIGLWGLGVVAVAALVSLGSWLVRGGLAKALPGLATLGAIPLMVVGIAPAIAMAVAAIGAVSVMVMHMRYRPVGGRFDLAVAALMGVGLLMVVGAWVLGSALDVSGGG